MIVLIWVTPKKIAFFIAILTNQKEKKNYLYI